MKICGWARYKLDQQLNASTSESSQSRPRSIFVETEANVQTPRQQNEETLFKRRSDFGTEQEYAFYVQTILQTGSRVRVLSDWDMGKEGDMGTYVGNQDIRHIAVVRWDEGTTFSIPFEKVEIISPESSSEGC